MDIIVTLAVATVLCYLVWLFATGGVLGKYWKRPCTGSAWKRAFPQADKKRIRDFLTAFVDGFAFSKRRRLRFLPSDRVMDIYRCVKGPVCDDMELEFFDNEIEARYGRTLESIWHEDITLGEVFSKMTRPDARA